MTPAEQQGMLKQFYNALKDEPLSPESKYYVPYLDEHPEEDYIAFLGTEILFSEAAGVNLLSGQRGTGKSTQLRRLRKMLEEQGCVVFLSDMREYMHMTSPVEITDFFLSIMGALAEQVEERYGANLLKEGYWERIRRFLSTEVQIDELTLGGGGAEIKASLKNDVSFRRQLQDRMRGHVARLIQQSHEFAAQVVDAVRRHGGDEDKKVVLLIDSVEQIRGVGAEAESVYKSVENLFSGHADSLKLPLLHVVYTIPPWLPAITPGLGAVLGTVHTLPSIHIYQTRSREPDAAGLAVMREIVDARCSSWRQIFTESQLDRIALNSGGDLREFFYLIKQCLTRAGASRAPWPVPDDLIAGGENNIR
ncbi:MAG: ATP-binding protein, partial [Gemmatimonadota bacterium]|nr:ATP-binding protein [Gemmatimonadota bacterium]